MANFIEPNMRCTHSDSIPTLAEPELRRMVIWDWYDGPETGLLICDKCQAEFYFYMVDWSHDRNIRVFALQHLRASAVKALVQLVDEEPQWPIWMPRKLKFPVESDRHWIDQLDSVVLGELDAPLEVLAWNNLKHKPLRMAQITKANSQYTRKLLESDYSFSPYNWLEYLGLSR